MRDLNEFHVPVTDNLDIFGILNRLAEKGFTSFRTFVEKLSSVRSLSIEHICAPLTEANDVFSLLSLSSFNTPESFTICECSKSRKSKSIYSEVWVDGRQKF
uniref:Transposase n=1 Tax=Strongyloides venezuelensis TaxID=75913 RepID=A0A0K0FZN2_STRVS